jgi:hypothetical protein
MRDESPENLEYWRIRDRIVDVGACCDAGVRVYCFCRASSKCPIHGEICIGSHD